MCLFPQLVRNPKYIPNKKNNGNVPIAKDSRVYAVPRACGKCRECRKKKRRDWQIRMLEEVKKHTNGHMVTLTFTTESLKEINKIQEVKEKKGYEKDNKIAKIAVRRFLERWRKEHKKSLRHWLVTELGEGKTEHIHIHGVVWTNHDKGEIQKHWKYGKVWCGYENKRTYVNEQTVNYITKYITKTDTKHKEYNPIILCTPGIGGSYTETERAKNNRYKENTNETYKTKTGHKIALPVYYRNKIYTDEEKEKLWIEKLDKKIRYINGIKIDISQGEERYYKILKYAQTQNKTMGYGNHIKDWEQSKYEKERRIMLHNKRLEE